ncbi:MAG: hypothetical protein HWD83_01795 [Gammaproteobacteria bacterium]|nr:hypothetical protein [Gammaproteobacteria bacterium]
MTLRKLSAAVLASTLATGAMAQVTDSDSLSLALEVTEVNEVLFQGTSATFGGATSGSTATDALCVFSNANDYDLTVSSTNSFNIKNGKDTLVPYALTIGGTAANGGTVNKAGLTTASGLCSGTPSYDNAVVATLSADVTEAGSYSDEITVTIASI